MNDLCILNFDYLYPLSTVIVFIFLVIILNVQILRTFLKLPSIFLGTDEFGGTKRDWKGGESWRDDVATEPQ